MTTDAPTPSPPTWRPMRATDLPAIATIAAAVHPTFPEDPGIFAERLHLYPAGCHVLDATSALLGYIISHPWHAGSPPKLNTRLGQLPANPALFYIHDLALLPACRGQGFGAPIVAQLAATQGLTTMALVAVSGSAPFWRQCGFTPDETHTHRATLATYDGSAQFMLRRARPPSTP